MMSAERCIKKLGKMKFPRGIKLDGLQTYNRSTGEPKGISVSSEFIAKWIYVPGKGLGIYKTYDGLLPSGPSTPYSSNVRKYNELLCAKLCDILNIPHAQYETARYKKSKGLISYNILRENEELVSLISNPGFLGDFIEEVKGKGTLNYIEIKDMIHTLYSYMLFDIRTLQTDRNYHNIPIAKDRHTDKIRVPEMMDSEFAYMSYNMIRNRMGGDDYFGLFGDSKELDVEEVIQAYDIKMNRTKSAYCLSAYKFQDDRTLENRIQEACILASLSPDLNKIFEEFMNNFSLDRAIEELRKEGIKASPDYIRYIKTLDRYVAQRFEYHREHGEEYAKKYLEAKPEEYSHVADRLEIMHILGIAMRGSESIVDSISHSYELFKKSVRNKCF